MKFVADGICFSYNSHPVLSDVSFRIESGSMMCVLGVNGAGKSTLLRCMNRILSPSHGTVLLDGKDLFHMGRTEVARLIGYVPQRHSDSSMNVFETVLLGRKPHMGWKAGQYDYAVVERVIQQTGIHHLAMRPVCELSGGEVQKVIIARALAQTPDILLLDEPTSNLDLKNQLEVMRLIRSIVETSGLSAVVAIHDLNISLRFGHSFLFLKDQKVHAISTREELSSETIGQVYGVRVALKEFEGHTLVVPLSEP